jgi:hypothetical protein
MISRTFHAFLDYLSCMALFLAPWAFKFSDASAAMAVAIGAGVVILLSSLCTKYEGGLFRVVPMAVHLNLDILLGLFLISAPWLFSFHEKVLWPHVCFGLLAIVAGLLTVRQSTREPSSLQY